MASSSDSDDDASYLVTSKVSATTSPQKHGRQSVVSSQLASILDQSGLNDRAAMMIVFEAARSLGHDPETLALNRSTIQCQRHKHREAEAAGIKVAFNPNTSLTRGRGIDLPVLQERISRARCELA